MSTLKVLEAPTFLREPWEVPQECGWFGMLPVFNRDGLYATLDMVWAEVDGKAWLAPPGYRKHIREMLQEYDTPWFRDCEVEAFHTVWRHLPEGLRQDVARHTERLRKRDALRAMQALVWLDEEEDEAIHGV